MNTRQANLERWLRRKLELQEACAAGLTEAQRREVARNVILQRGLADQFCGRITKAGTLGASGDKTYAEVFAATYGEALTTSSAELV